MRHLLSALTIGLISCNVIAKPHAIVKPIIVPQPTSCITATFAATGGEYWKNISLTLQNQCGSSVDFQSSTITFTNSSNLNTAFWGNFGPLSYPDNNLQITSQPQANGKFLSTLSLHFPVYTGSNSVLGNGQSIVLQYGAPTADFVVGSVGVYLGTTPPPPTTGQINLTNATSKPSDVTQTYALVNVTMNGQPVSSVQLPWAGQMQLPGLAAGTYAISPASVASTDGNTYLGTANPASVTVVANQTVASSISYALQPVQKGSINIKLQALPSVLSGYTGVPSVTLTQSGTGTTIAANTNWNATTNVGNLALNSTYTFSTPTIVFNSNTCTPTFTPTSAQPNATTPPTTNLTYACVQIPPDNITLNVSGVPTTTSTVTVTLTPNNNSAPVTQNVSLTNGSGNANVSLTDGTIYTVTSTSINGYTTSYNPQPLTARASATEAITYTKNAPSTGGKIISYLPGWKTPPTAASIATAGYTHILVAFGVFSTTTPGQIVSAFDTVTLSYIQSLQSLGVKVLLSIGGASSSVPNTTVNFDQVVTAASSPAAFEQTFIQSLESLITQYGFDGFDFDIEQGFNAGGTFTNPQGDIAVLANIINTMHANHPSLLLTLVPQAANISATQGFDNTWGNYSSLVMQTYNSLAWVGVQLYNTGCTLGIDNVCYDPNATSSPNFAVAMATDLLANWPATDPSGRQTGFQPYISYLNPSQVVVGFPAPNAAGQSDGAPVTPIATIKSAIQCLRTNVAGSNSCGTFVPPKAYPGIGGVFNWEITYDQNNNFQFATGLKNCVINGNCS